MPAANLIVDTLVPAQRRRGAALAFGRAIAETGLTPASLGEAIATGSRALSDFDDVPDAAGIGALRPHVDAALAMLRARREERRALLERLPQEAPPLLT